ncbi:probable F-box protein At5g04010 [Zingiber officinale]|uniref:F-box family protein n=1 Tax=Zingiber officinale TaxID=94328 RepID=A0A8J5KLA7_ZINOF|nr:probable F-box protein At5g04010 [Zingiber officinale]KAG6483994.1 hypothetical protein ZIOFF_060787 [Zingiber officinale]
MAATTRLRGSQATAATPPPWEVLQLVSRSMDDDPKSVAVACCVSKPSHDIFTSDRLWTLLCRSLFPSSAHSAVESAISPRHLFWLLHTTTARRRVPSPLRLSLSHLLFFLDIFQRGAPVLSLARAATELVAHPGIFRFSVPIGRDEAVVLDASEEPKVAWTVATTEWREAFALMEFEGQGKSVGNREMWLILGEVAVSIGVLLLGGGGLWHRGSSLH